MDLPKEVKSSIEAMLELNWTEDASSYEDHYEEVTGDYRQFKYAKDEDIPTPEELVAIDERLSEHTFYDLLVISNWLGTQEE